MSALESPHLLLPLEKPTDRRAANPAVAQAVQAESAGGGRAAATRLPAKDPLGPQRPRQVPPTEGTSSAAGRCGLQACRAESPFPLLKATPCVVFVMAPVPAPPTPVRGWLITRLFPWLLLDQAFLSFSPQLRAPQTEPPRTGHSGGPAPADSQTTGPGRDLVKQAHEVAIQPLSPTAPGARSSPHPCATHFIFGPL